MLADLAGRPQRVDKMMLDNAREHGVDAHEGVHVLDGLFDGDRKGPACHRLFRDA